MPIEDDAIIGEAFLTAAPFTEELRKVGEIRNDVMHFHPDGVIPEDLSRLRKFARFLSDLEKKLAS